MVLEMGGSGRTASVSWATENDIDMRLAKAWTAIDMLSIVRKSDQSNKIKRKFFQAAVVSILLYRCTTQTLTKRDGNCTRMLRATLNKYFLIQNKRKERQDRLIYSEKFNTYIYIYIYIFIYQPLRTTKMWHKVLTGLNSEFSFS